MSTAGNNGRIRALLLRLYLPASDILWARPRHCAALSDVDYARPWLFSSRHAGDRAGS